MDCNDTGRMRDEQTRNLRLQADLAMSGELWIPSGRRVGEEECESVNRMKRKVPSDMRNPDASLRI